MNNLLVGKTDFVTSVLPQMTNLAKTRAGNVFIKYSQAKQDCIAEHNTFSIVARAFRFYVICDGQI